MRYGSREQLTHTDEKNTEYLEIANEFATVVIRKVLTRNGVRLEIRSPKLGTFIHLDPLALESLTWQTHETFAKLLSNPYEPSIFH